MGNLTEYQIVIITLLFIFIFWIFAIISVIPFLVLKYLRKRYKLKEKYFSNWKLALYLFIITVSMAFYESYTAVFPNDSFYYEEFEYVTNRKIPGSEIKFKDSDYPDFHGDYSSKSIIELSQADFDKLLKDLQNDKTLIESKNDDKNILKVFERKIIGEEDRYLFIRFKKDGKTIVVNVDFT